jgi:hypothetical protein
LNSQADTREAGESQGPAGDFFTEMETSIELEPQAEQNLRQNVHEKDLTANGSGFH